MNSLDESENSLPAPVTWGEQDPHGLHAASMTVKEYKSRIETIMQMSCNQTCADCSAQHPKWASLLLLSSKDCVVVEGLGVVVCQECAVHHHYELGEKRAFIKYLGYPHEWTHPELDILEYCGNDLINEVYEATLSASDRHQDRDEAKQAKFIKNKYKKCQYRDQQAMEEALDLVTWRAEKAEKAKQDVTRSSRRRSSDMSQLAGLKQDDSSGSLLSLCSELNGSSLFSLYDVIDEEDFYLSCAKKGTHGSDPSLKTNFTWGEREVPTRSASDPCLMAENRNAWRSDRSPRKPVRRVSNDQGPRCFAPTRCRLRKRCKPMVLKRMATNPVRESPKEVIPLRRAQTVEPEELSATSRVVKATSDASPGRKIAPRAA